MKRPDHIDLPAAWRGVDMAADPSRWTRPFGDAEIAEIEAAAECFLDAGIDLGEMSSEKFPLPTVGPILERLRNDLQHGIGFGLLTGLPVDTFSIEMSCTIFCGVGSHLGSARSQNAKGHLLGHVKDVGSDLKDMRTRIYQTSARQTFHTDSTDAVGLFCLQEAMEGGDSLLASTLTIYNEMMRRRPDLVELLFQPVATDRRGEVPEGEKPYFMIPVMNWFDGQLTGLCQRQYINSAERFPDAPRPSKDHIAALDLFDEIANDPDIHLTMRLKPGDMQFVYNHTNLHDRTSFQDWPNPKRKRHLLRLWLSLPDDRPLPPVFAERYGSIKIGDRGGVIVKGTKLNVPLEP